MDARYSTAYTAGEGESKCTEGSVGHPHKDTLSHTGRTTYYM